MASTATSTEYSTRCLLILLAASDACGETKSSAYKAPPPGSSVKDVAASLRRAKISNVWRDSDGNRVDLSNPSSVIAYVEERIDLIIGCMEDTNRHRFLRVREQHYKNPKHDDERNLRQLKEFYSIFDPKFAGTCDAHIARLKKQYKIKFSWDNVWAKCQKRYGENPKDMFMTEADLQIESLKDADEMEKVLSLLSTAFSADEKKRETKATMTLARGCDRAGNSFNKISVDTTKPLKEQLASALANLRKAGGKELHPASDNEEDDDGPIRYMAELLDVCDIRYKLGEYELAGANYFRCYNLAMGWNSDSSEKNCSVFPIGHKWFQSWMRTRNDNYVQFACLMALELVKKEGCPGYIRNDLSLLKKMTSPVFSDKFDVLEILNDEFDASSAEFTSNLITLPNGAGMSAEEKENCVPPRNAAKTPTTTCGNANCNKKGHPNDNEGNKLLRCARCKSKFYCSKSCQRDDWKWHKHADCVEASAAAECVPPSASNERLMPAAAPEVQTF